MKKLGTMKEIESYISDLERQLFSLKSTHAYRVGLALMSFYDSSTTKKIVGLNKFVNEIIAGTKKVTKDRFSPQSKVVIADHLENTTPSRNDIESTGGTLNSQYLYLPVFKERRLILTLADTSFEEGYQQITPYNFENFIKFGNFDEIEFDLSLLEKISCWRNFGTYDDIHRTNIFLGLLMNNKLIYKKLIHKNNLLLHPILLDNIAVFDSVVIGGNA